MNNKQLFTLVLIVFLTVIAWIGFDLYHASKTSVITPTQSDLTKPLTPSFDNDIILKIKSRER